jgi:hypothetical protein
VLPIHAKNGLALSNHFDPSCECRRIHNNFSNRHLNSQVGFLLHTFVISTSAI